MSAFNNIFTLQQTKLSHHNPQSLLIIVNLQGPVCLLRLHWLMLTWQSQTLIDEQNLLLLLISFESVALKQTILIDCAVFVCVSLTHRLLRLPRKISASMRNEAGWP